MKKLSNFSLDRRLSPEIQSELLTSYIEKFIQKSSLRSLINRLSEEFLIPEENFEQDIKLFLLNNFKNSEGKFFSKFNLIYTFKSFFKNMAVYFWILINESSKNKEKLFFDIIVDDISHKNEIYRLYPISLNQYEPRECRFDKRKPNSYKIITNLINMYKFDWNLNLGKKIYYTHVKNFVTKKWRNILENQFKTLVMMIKLIEPDVKKNWYDFGCGRGKVSKHIRENYHPFHYLGIDIDFNNILHCIKKYGNNTNNKEYFLPLDLSSDWDNYDKSWYNLDYNVKADYIICNFSLMHFCTDKFWKQVNKLSYKGSKILLNLVNNKIEKRIDVDGSYMYLDKENNEIKYFFSYIHKKEMTEKYISDNDFKSIINKFNWKIKKLYQPKSKGIEGYYNWYILEKY